MKKTLIIIVCAAMPMLASAQQIIGDTAYGIKPMPYEEASLTADLLQQEQTLRTIYLCVMLIAVAASLLTYWVMSRRLRKYSELVNLQGQALNQQKHNAEGFGLMLNLAQFPCCLVGADNKIIWSNDAFISFFGKDRKEMQVLEGTPEGTSLSPIKNNQMGTTLFVKMKNAYGKTLGYKRTIIPIKNGDNGFAIIENITD